MVSLQALAECAAAAATCRQDGRPPVELAVGDVAGPVGVSVADARVEERAGAVPAFAVTLSRAASRAASVDYATSDGSAQAGEDYTAKSGAEVRGRRVGEEGRGGGARRRARRGRGDADAVESVGRAGGRRGAGHDRERGPDAGGAAGQLRPGDGRAGGDPRRGADGGDLSAAFPGAAGGPGFAAGQRAGPQFAQPMGDGRGGLAVRWAATPWARVQWRWARTRRTSPGGKPEGSGFVPPGAAERSAVEDAAGDDVPGGSGVCRSVARVPRCGQSSRGGGLRGAGTLPPRCWDAAGRFARDGGRARRSGRCGKRSEGPGAGRRRRQPGLSLRPARVVQSAASQAVHRAVTGFTGKP